MPFNPCGRVVDYARREYKTLARLFRDSDTLVEIQWYRVPEDAPRLPWPSSIMSKDWTDSKNDRPWLTELGEVLDAPRPYSFKGGLIDPRYDHVCGTEADFREGAVFDPDREVKYDEQGLPLCCRQPRVMSLGVVFGLEVAVEQDVNDTCASAIPIALGEEVVTTIPPGGSRWYSWFPGGIGSHRLEFSGAGSYSAVLWFGFSCPPEFGGGSISSAEQPCRDFSVGTFVGQWWFQWVNVGGTPATVTFNVDVGLC